MYTPKLGSAAGDGLVVRFVLWVDGHHRAITSNGPPDMMDSQSLDLRPFLRTRKTVVRLQWKVLNEQTRPQNSGARIIRTAYGTSEVLA